MSIGERIRYFRTKKGMTQKYLGMQIGLSDASAEVRITQYETGKRIPQTDRLLKIAKVLDVSPHALDISDQACESGLMHTLFVLEDLYGVRPDIIGGELCLRLNGPESEAHSLTLQLLQFWLSQTEKVAVGTLSKEHYDLWR